MHQRSSVAHVSHANSTGRATTTLEEHGAGLTAAGDVEGCGSLIVSAQFDRVSGIVIEAEAPILWIVTA